MSPASPTSFADVLMLLAVVVAATTVMTLVRTATGWVQGEAVRLQRMPMMREVQTPVVAARVRAHYRSWRGLGLSMIPGFAFVAGLTVFSVLRDRGLELFFWPMAVVAGLWGLAWALTSRLHARMILRSLSRPCEETT